jgi:uncharacterized protein YyaL (SSP411 family)
MLQIKLQLLFSVIFFISCGKSNPEKRKDISVFKFTNRLVNETSPYLLQHANNPVDWYPWGEEAFEKARTENKPILVSIGYAACHWCHVMEHESFENEETAKLMNDLFVCIKVDREERPDVDQIYMMFVQMTTGSGGWPLNVFLTPELEPFFGGTYFPPDHRYGRPSWQKTLKMASNFYHNEKESLNKNLNLIKEAYEKSMVESASENLPNNNTFDIAAKNLSKSYDMQYGGLGRAPKFPAVQPLSFFLRYYKSTGNKDYLDMVTYSLRNMAEGGIYDQIGGGFARYSVDNKWLVPHFEKMIYDNAQLVPVYIDAYLITKDDFYLRIVKETLEFVNKELKSEEGGFFSSLDADSEGEEGKFYVWEKSEIDELLGEHSAIFCDYFDVTENGNFEGKNILNIQTDLYSSAKRFNKTEKEVQKILNECSKILMKSRDKRIRPGLDDKVLTAWNALMLSAYARVYQVLRDEKYKTIIEQNIQFLKKNLYKNGELLRTHNKGKSQYSAYLDDHAYLIAALIDSYEALFNPEYLEWAKELLEFTNQNFWDDKNAGYFYTAPDQKNLIYRMKDDNDQSIPSGTAVMAMNNLRFYSLSEDATLVEKTERIFKKYADKFESNPYGFSSYLLALDFYLQKPQEIVIISQKGKSAIEYYESIFNNYFPNKIVVSMPQYTNLQIFTASLLQGKEPIDGKTTVYVCHNFSCSQPIFSIEEFESYLNRN